MNGPRIRGLTLYLRDPGVGPRYWHYRGHRPRLYGSFWCRLVGHSWHYWEGGHVHAGDDWGGEWRDDHPWTPGFRSCRRCEAQS